MRVLALTALLEGGMLVFAFMLAWLTGYKFWQHAKLDLLAFAHALILTLPLLIALYAASRTSWSVLTQIRRDLQLVLPFFRDCTILDLLLISLIAGVGEEALFRGVLQPVAAGVLGELPGFIAVSVLFGLAHYLSTSYALFAAAMGLYLGAIQLYTGNLFISAAVHALYDFAALVYLLRVNVR